MTKDKPDARGKDLIDLIADMLPADRREDYYRHMLYCDSLPESDELLRVIHAMGYLTLLTREAPSLILAEREKFEYICEKFADMAKNLLTTESRHFEELNRRMTALPAEIANGISPEAIVGQINAILKRLFEQSTIPVIAKDLSETGKTLQAATKELTQSFEKLCGSWNSAADRAHRAIAEIEVKVTSAVAAAEQAMEKLVSDCDKNERWSFRIVASLYAAMAFVLVLFLCKDVLSSSNPSASETAPDTEVQTQSAKPNPASRKK